MLARGRFAEGYHEITAHPSGILAGEVENNAVRQGHLGRRDPPRRGPGIRTVALGGFLTDCCVGSTMRSAYEKGGAAPDS